MWILMEDGCLNMPHVSGSIPVQIARRTIGLPLCFQLDGPSPGERLYVYVRTLRRKGWREKKIAVVFVISSRSPWIRCHQQCNHQRTCLRCIVGALCSIQQKRAMPVQSIGASNMLKLIHNKSIPKYFLALVGLVIAAYFALNAYPVGEWAGQRFLHTIPAGPQTLGIVCAAFMGICV